MQSELVLHNVIEEIPRLNHFISDFIEKTSVDSAEEMGLRLALEEVVVNIIHYAYPKGRTGEIIVTVCADEKEIRFLITDSGETFDPTKVPEADISLGINEREIGGLGIFLVRHMMDDMKYERTDGQNRLTLIKYL